MSDDESKLDHRWLQNKHAYVKLYRGLLSLEKFILIAL